MYTRRKTKYNKTFILNEMVNYERKDFKIHIDLYNIYIIASFWEGKVLEALPSVEGRSTKWK